MIKKVTAAALKSRIADRRSLAIVDVRDEDTFASRHLLVASCLPISRIEVLAPRLLPRLSLPIVICDDGDGHAEIGYRRLTEAGYSDVSILDGGIAAWEAAGFRLYSGVHVVSKAFAEVVEHVCETPHLSPDQVKKKIDSKEDMVIFDSRSFEEYNNNSIPTARSVPGAELVYRVQELVPSPETTIVVNCGGRTRSIIGAQVLRNAGVPNPIYSLENGTMGWFLAGFDMETGGTKSIPDVSADGFTLARSRAKAMADKFGVRAIDKKTLAKFRQQSSSTTLHVIDVRPPAEFQKGHLASSLNCAGGQLVQETDNWIADFQARIVLVDDTEVRSIVTASWLIQMGYSHVYVLVDAFQGEALEAGQGAIDAVAQFPLDGPAPIELWPSRESLKDPGGTIVDVSLSKAFIKMHIPGAWHAVRSRLLSNLGKLPTGRPLIFTSEDGVLAKFAAAEVAKFTNQQTYVMSGGNAAWQSAGLETERGETNMLDEPDDVWYAPRDRKTNLHQHMRDYLSWEIDLVKAIDADGDCAFHIVRS